MSTKHIQIRNVLIKNLKVGDEGNKQDCGQNQAQEGSASSLLPHIGEMTHILRILLSLNLKKSK